MKLLGVRRMSNYPLPKFQNRIRQGLVHSIESITLDTDALTPVEGVDADITETASEIRLLQPSQ